MSDETIADVRPKPGVRVHETTNATCRFTSLYGKHWHLIIHGRRDSCHTTRIGAMERAEELQRPEEYGT